MKKIKSLFCRNYEGDKLVRDEVVPGSEWVVAGEGVATRKWDGTACLVRGGRLFARYDAKHGKTPPDGFEPAQDPDPVTGHWPGWLPVGNGPEHRWHREPPLPDIDGTYELVGPKVNGNYERFGRHEFIRHGEHVLRLPDRSFAALRAVLERARIEGIVFHHPDGRMVKIKTRDFGFPWPPLGGAGK